MGVNSFNCPNNPENCMVAPDDEVRPKQFYAFNIVTRKDVKVTGATWLCLPDDEDDALRLGKTYCRQYGY